MSVVGASVITVFQRTARITEELKRLVVVCISIAELLPRDSQRVVLSKCIEIAEEVMNVVSDLMKQVKPVEKT